MLHNLKENVNDQISRKFYKGKGTVDTIVKTTPHIDNVDIQEMKNSPLKEVTVSTRTKTFHPDPKKPYYELKISVKEQGGYFNNKMRNSMYPNDKGPKLLNSRCNSIQYLETKAVHKSIRTLQNLKNQILIKKDGNESDAWDTRRKSILKVGAKSNQDIKSTRDRSREDPNNATRGSKIRMSFENSFERDPKEMIQTA